MAESNRDGSEEENGVKINDRRLFTPDGQLRSDFVREEEAEPPPGRSEPQRRSSTATAPDFERRPVEEPHGVDFTMLINAMAEPALLFLGEIVHPETGEPTVDLERARIQIDMLDLLRVKCRGNMTPSEEGLLDRILYQLRMLFVAKANQPEQR